MYGWISAVMWWIIHRSLVVCQVKNLGIRLVPGRDSVASLTVVGDRFAVCGCGVLYTILIGVYAGPDGLRLVKKKGQCLLTANNLQFNPAAGGEVI